MHCAWKQLNKHCVHSRRIVSRRKKRAWLPKKLNGHCQKSLSHMQHVSVVKKALATLGLQLGMPPTSGLATDSREKIRTDMITYGSRLLETSSKTQPS